MAMGRRAVGATRGAGFSVGIARTVIGGAQGERALLLVVPKCLPAALHWP